MHIFKHQQYTAPGTDQAEKHQQCGERLLQLFANRANLEQWLGDGKTTYGEIADQKALEILQTHACEALPHKIQEELAAIAAKAETALAGKHFDA